MRTIISIETSIPTAVFVFTELICPQCCDSIPNVCVMIISSSDAFVKFDRFCQFIQCYLATSSLGVYKAAGKVVLKLGVLLIPPKLAIASSARVQALP